ncbi:response regulator [Verrucomicrobiota bacterium]
MIIRVLVVDDHEMARYAIRRTLEAEPDIEIIKELTDGKNVLKFVRGSKPDVVIMDISLPDASGLDLTKQILEEFPDTRVIIISGYASEDLLHHVTRLEAHGCLSKATASLQIPQAIRTVHAGKTYVSPDIREQVLTSGARFREKSPLEKLSNRELQIMKMLVNGMTNTNIAKSLKLSVKSVDTYRYRIMQKLQTENVVDLVKFAVTHGITTTSTENN